VNLVFANLCATKIPAREKQIPSVKSNPRENTNGKAFGCRHGVGVIIVDRLGRAAAAWDRGHVDTFAVLPDYAPGVPESAQGLDGNIYVPSGGFNADGFVPGPATLWVFNPAGHLIRTVTLTGVASQPLGRSTRLFKEL